MTPIKKGTAARLGLRRPKASAYGPCTFAATGEPITHVVWPLGSPTSEEVYGWALLDGDMERSIEIGP